MILCIHNTIAIVRIEQIVRRDTMNIRSSGGLALRRHCVAFGDPSHRQRMWKSLEHVKKTVVTVFDTGHDLAPKIGLQFIRQMPCEHLLPVTIRRNRILYIWREREVRLRSRTSQQNQHQIDTSSQKVTLFCFALPTSTRARCLIAEPELSPSGKDGLRC